MKILFLTDGVTPFVTGGMQRHSENLCKALLPLVEQITLVHCVYEGKIPSSENLLESWGVDGANLEILGYEFPKPGTLPGHYVRNSKIYSRTVYKELKSRLLEFDFVYCKGFTDHSFIRYRKEHGVPVGVMLHGYEMFQQSYGIKQWLRFQLLKPIARYCTMNADVVFSYGGKITPLIQELGVPRSKIIESSGGIDESWLREESELVTNKPIRFLFIGRDERRKGLKELYECLNDISESFKFHFIGPLGPISDKRFIYHGEIKDKIKLMEHIDQCDVLVCPSHSEGMPNVIMEGMARGLAIIATDVGATSLLVNEKNGWLIPKKSSSSLIEAILSALSKDILINMKKQSLEKAKSLCFENVASKWFLDVNAKINQ